MKKLKEIAIWAVLAFFIGASLAIGQKTMDYIWPDNPIQLEVNSSPLSTTE